MKYYRVKPENDNRKRYRRRKDGGLALDGIWIGNELYTPKELGEYIGGTVMCDPVEIPKSQVYHFFGARFQSGKESAV